ncbi:hypothetical protein JXA63_02660 [Candidatus Woesebacteria bacterium]|nr:hypothetical protein [Candidatus Woesebacteria bacterium]
MAENIKYEKIEIEGGPTFLRVIKNGRDSLTSEDDINAALGRESGPIRYTSAVWTFGDRQATMPIQSDDGRRTNVGSFMAMGDHLEVLYPEGKDGDGEKSEGGKMVVINRLPYGFEPRINGKQ